MPFTAARRVGAGNMVAGAGRCERQVDPRLELGSEHSTVPVTPITST
jgi:hypothetical protein